jgi:subtilisin-like proprotein convertase family protein
MKLLLTTLVLALSFIGFSQINAFTKQDITEKFQGPTAIQTKSSKQFSVDIASLKNHLQNASYREDFDLRTSQMIIQLPHPDGTFKNYRVLRNKTLDPALNTQFPDILTFDGLGIDDFTERVKFDITPQGFHAMIRGPQHSTIFIDPVDAAHSTLVKVYYKTDFITDKQMDCQFQSAISNDKNAPIPAKIYGSCELRTYRLALSATGEYSSFHGGTKPLAQAAQATTMNRVNGVYETDMAITMTLIPNNGNIVYTNSTTDPFTNGNPGTMINQNQTNTDNIIGQANYDIGHVFGTNSGGLAGLAVVCGSSKARGVTGSGAPIGDPFDIDYVCHEIGHQFSGNHTQNNNCNRNAATAVEPGSASSIMGYAGICTPNVQNNSDDHFHGTSLLEISNFITSTGHTCPVKTTLSNNPPAITSTNGNMVIPKSTPFALKAIATDADNDPLTYNWEQIDNQVSTQPPVATSTSGPSFRSWPSSADPTRYFPKLTAVANNGPFTWERLPSVSRTMNFRVSVRDNSAAGGCGDYMDVTVTTTANAGPFVVNYPSATGISWAGLSNQTVTWAVANTDQAPINASNVNIYLSIDGGQTYPTIVASNVTNNGSAAITAPNTPSTTARIMVMSSAGTFFDVSDNNFTITAATNDYTISGSPTSLSVCEGTDAVYTINSAAAGSFNDPITLSVPTAPGGSTASFSVNPINPGQSSTLTLTGGTAGNYSFAVEGNSTTGTKTVQLTLDITPATPGTITLVSPSAGATGVENPTNFTWSTTGTGATFDVDLASDAGFTNIVESSSGLTVTNYTSQLLNLGTIYYWRVRSVNSCNQSAYVSESFTTGSCFVISSANVPVSIPTTAATVTSSLNVPFSGTIADINVLNLEGTHTYISDLTFTLINPASAEVVLFDGVCATEDDFDVNFDDAAASATLPCPPVSGLTYKPDGILSDFNGSNAQGNWTLRIVDAYAQDGGSLDKWELEICMTNVGPCNGPTTPTVSGASTSCEEEEVTLTVASGTLNDATEWTWYSGSCNGTVVGTGTSISVSPNSTITYYVRGTGGCVASSTCGSHAITVSQVDETMTVSGQTGTANASGAQYQWLDCDNSMQAIAGATNQSYTVTATGSYAVVVTMGGCSDTSDCTTINGPCVQPTVPTVTGATNVCAGESTTLSIASGDLNDAADWEWYTGSCGGLVVGSGTSIVVSPAGTAVYFVRGFGGCVTAGSCESHNIAVTTVNNGVTQAGNTLSAQMNGAQYQWLDCDNNFQTIPGATSQSFTPSALVGQYAVDITFNGCTDRSNCFTIDQTGLNDLNSIEFNLFPNPTDGQLNLTWDKNMQVDQIEVVDMQGRTINASVKVGEGEAQIDMRKQAPAVYFVKINSQNQHRMMKFTKQ